MKKLSIAGALALTLSAGVALAQEAPTSIATLGKVNGKVMVDRGAGYTAVTGATQLSNGNRVITLAGSSAEITFVDGCKAELKENNVMVISAAEGCKAAITQATPTGGSGGPGTPVSQIIGPIVAAGVVIGILSEWDDLDSPISAQ